MYKVVTPEGVFGPYSVVAVMDDRYRCDGADLPFTVVGQGTVSPAQDGDFNPIVTTDHVVPRSITARQARIILLQAGLLDSVNQAVAASNEATRIEWEFSTEVQRNWPTLKTMAQALGWTDQQLDDLFIAGSKL